MQRMLPRAATVLCALILAGTITYHISRNDGWRSQEAPSETVSQSIPSRVPATEMGAGTSGLGQLHLFGRQKSKDVAKQEVAEAPETKLNLTLTGVFFSNVDGTARAIIAGPDGEELQYAVGDLLPANASLHSVHRHKAIIARAGRLESLSLATTENNNTPAAGAKPVRVRQSRARRVYRAMDDMEDAD